MYVYVYNQHLSHHPLAHMSHFCGFSAALVALVTFCSRHLRPHLLTFLYIGMLSIYVVVLMAVTEFRQ